MGLNEELMGLNGVLVGFDGADWEFLGFQMWFDGDLPKWSRFLASVLRLF